jgi:hypothetical protein
MIIKYNKMDEEEQYTIKDVIRNIEIIQDMKLLFLQSSIFNGKDVIITNIVDKKALLRTIEKYRNHYSTIEINEHNIVIKRLSKLSFLRVGLEKEILTFMENYF